MELSYRSDDNGSGTRMAGKLYFDPKQPSGFSSKKRLHAAARGRTLGELRELLEAQNTYTLHRPVRKKFPHNPYTVNNIMDVWECDLVDVQGSVNITTGSSIY